MSREGNWCYSYNGEEFTGDYDNREDAIDEAMSCAEEDILFIYVGVIKEIKLNADVDMLIDRLAEFAYERGGDYAEYYLNDVTKEEFKELEDGVNDVLLKWINKYHKPNFWEVVNVEKVKV